MALLRRGDLSVTEVCFAVGCSSLGTFSTRFTELVGVPPSTYRRQAARRDGGDAAVRGEAGDQTGQESRSAGPRAAPSVTAMDITIHYDLPPARRPGRLPGLLPRHPRLRGPQRRRLRRDALDHGRPRRPARHVHRAAPAGRRPRHHRRRAPHHRRDDGQGHLRHASSWPPRTSTAPSSGCRPATPRSCRSRPSSRTASATAPSATPRATWSASTRCADHGDGGGARPRDPQGRHAGDARDPRDRHVGRHSVGCRGAAPRARVAGLGGGASGDRGRGVLGHRTQPDRVRHGTARRRADSRRGDDRRRPRGDGATSRPTTDWVRPMSAQADWDPRRDTGYVFLVLRPVPGAGLARGERDRRPHAHARRQLGGLSRARNRRECTDAREPGVLPGTG